MGLSSPLNPDQSDRFGTAIHPMGHSEIGAKLAQIEAILARIERLAHELRVEPDDQLRRAASELRAAFGARSALEPAVGRMRHSLLMLRRGNDDRPRLERAQALDHLDGVLERELLPHLRRLGFEL